MKKTKLKNGPLKEVVFELLWELRNDDDDVIDSGFQLAQGKFEERITNEFVVLKKVGTAEIKIHKPVYQFWKDELKWPVIHFGPGILAVSDTEHEYEWSKTLAPAIAFALECLQKSYDHELSFSKMKLRYVDAVDLDNGDELVWISEHLQTSLQTQYQVPGKLNAFRIDQAFTSDEGAEIQLSIENAFNNSTSKRAVMWTTSIQKNGFFRTEDVISWINYAHEVCSDLFIKNLNPKFYALLDR